MDELKWELLTEIQGRWEADVIKAYLAAHGIDSELFQEALAQFYPTTLDIMGRVQIFVPKKHGKQAHQLLKQYYEPREVKPVRRKSNAEAKVRLKTTKHSNKRR